MNLDPYLKPITNINSKWTKGLDLRAKTTICSEENSGTNSYDAELDHYFLDLTVKAQNKKIHKMDFINIKNICHSTK